jgi:hypothetical protein
MNILKITECLSGMNFEEMNFEDAEDGDGAAMGAAGGTTARARRTLGDGDAPAVASLRRL